MSVLARKLATFRRVAHEQGVAGVLDLLEQKTHWFHHPIHRLANSLVAAPSAIHARRHWPPPRMLLAYFGGIGDDLLLTTVLRELRRRGFDGVWMMSEYADLYRLNDDPERVVPWTIRHDQWLRAFGWPMVRPWYSRYERQHDRDVPPPRHILAMMCEHAGIVGPVTLRPYLTLDDAERAAGRLAPRQIAIQSSGLDARFSMLTKQWFVERFQQVVDTLRPDLALVQVGSRRDPPLDGVLDLRGKTSLRQTAAVVAQSETFIGTVGFLMHLARAVDVRSVIVYGGREQPWQSGYPCNENLVSDVPCAPCWKLNSCDLDRGCMREIEAADVVAAVHRAIARQALPLETDVEEISIAGVPQRTTPDGRVILMKPDVHGRVREIEAKFPPPELDRPRRLPVVETAEPLLGHGSPLLS